MKKKKYAYHFLSMMISCGLLFLCSCDDSGNQPPGIQNNIWRNLESNPEFSILVTALQRAGFSNQLIQNGPFSIFAPNNEAFEVFLSNQLISNIDTIPVVELQALLRFHLLSGRLLTKNMQTREYLTFLPDQTLEIQVNNGMILLQRDVNILREDIDAVNGTIHEIDKVLEPRDQ